jgi:carbonic anhydrase/acetyltransferase-like protein (isoleucine patch superfamily)
LGREPRLGREVFLAPGAVVVGDVVVGAKASVWYNAVLRGDINRIEIGRCSNIQDNAVLHVADDYPCVVGDRVTVGHGAILHGCTLESDVLIGMGATVLDGARIGSESMLGANTLVTQRTGIPPGSLVIGSPGRVVRSLTDAERAHIRAAAAKYVALATYCRRQGLNSGPCPLVRGVGNRRVVTMRRARN